MAHYIDADRLRAEIEKERKKALDSTKRGGLTISDIATADVLAEVLLIIEQLKKEQPMDGLEDELKDYLRRYYNCDYPMQIEENTCSPTMPHIVEAARHFAKWGAEWQAKQDQETIELAEEHAYLAGSVNEREKMMKEAVEGLICATITGTNAISFLSPLPKELTAGDKVRIIIVKED